MRRRFNASERRALYFLQEGICAKCGKPLPKGWHGDHIHPWSKGGETDILNAQALCQECNQKKGKNTWN